MSNHKKLGNILKFDGAIMLTKDNDSHFKFYSKKQNPMPAIAEQVGFKPTGNYDHRSIDRFSTLFETIDRHVKSD